MNERIQELIEQSGAGDVTPVGFHKYLEKFAELIVRECAMFVVVELEGQAGSLIADTTANRLEKHFGVE